VPYLYRKALLHSDALVANSREALERLKSDLRIERPSASQVIYNGCVRGFESAVPSPAAPGRQNRPIQLCSISMFRPEKKQIRLLQICNQLPAEIDWRLVLAGTGPTLGACQAESARLGLDVRVAFPGLLEDPRSLYLESDVAVHASDRESL